MKRNKYNGIFRDQNGNVVGSSTTSNSQPGTVTVYLAGTTTLASVYTAETGGTAVNSVSTDAYGYFYFWIEKDIERVKLVMSHADFTTATYDNVDVNPKMYRFYASDFEDVDTTGATDSLSGLETFVAYVKAKADTGLRVVGVFDGNLLLSGTLELDGDYILWQVNGQMTADAGMTANDPLLLLSGSRSNLFTPVLHGANVAAGIKVTGYQWIIHYPRVENFAYRGIDLSGSAGGTYVLVPHVTQWNSDDTEFATDSNFDAVGIYFNRADDNVIGGISRWCGTCVEFSDNAATSWLIAHHPYNGRPTGDARVDSKNIIVRAGAGGVNIRDCYLDNGQIDLYSHQVRIRNCSFLCNSNVSFTDEYVIGVFADGTDKPYALDIDTFTANSINSGYSFIKYLDYDGNSWTGDYSAVDIGSNTCLKTVNRIVEVQNRDINDVSYRTIIKPAGTINTDYIIGADTVCSEEVAATYHRVQTDIFRVLPMTETATKLYLGSSGNGIVEDGSGKLTIRAGNADRLEVLATGVLRPVSDGATNLGGSSNRWDTVYASTGSINTSDEREKVWLGELDEAEKKVAVELSKLPGKFQFNSAIALKGDVAARIHVGVTAQKVKAVFDKYELDGFRYGVLCYDEWEEDARLKVTAGNRYGIRYDELAQWQLVGMNERLLSLGA